MYNIPFIIYHLFIYYLCESGVENGEKPDFQTTN